MYILKRKYKDSIVYYLAESYVDPTTKKNTSKVVERLGSAEELAKKLGKKVDIDKWTKKYAKEYKKDNRKINISTNNSKREIKNLAYLFFKQACKDIRLDILCKRIQKKENLDFDLFACLYHMLTSKMLYSDVSTNTIISASNSMEGCNFTSKDISKTIEILAKYNRKIQQFVFKEIDKTIYKEDKNVFFASSNCTSIYKKLLGYSANTDENSIYVYKIYYGEDNMPRGFSLEKYKDNTKTNLINFDDYIIANTKKSNLIICPDTLIMPSYKKIFNKYKTCKKVSFQNIKNYDEDIQAWALDSKNWKINGTDEIIDLDSYSHSIEKDKSIRNSLVEVFSNIYIKQKNLDDSNEKLTVILSFEKQVWAEEVRYNNINYIQDKIESSIRNSESDNYQNFIKKYQKALRSVTFESDDKMEITNAYLFNDQLFHKDEKFDGFTSILGNYSDKLMDSIIQITYKQNDIIKYLFNSIKQDFFVDENQDPEANLVAHFLTSFLSIIIFKVLNSKFDNKYWYYEILNFLEKLNFYHVPNEGWIPLFDSNETVKNLQSYLDINIDSSFIDEHDMAQIIL